VTRKQIDRVCKCGVAVPWYSNVCGACSAIRRLNTRYISGAAYCQSQVAIARAKGLIPSPRSFPCADCNGAATEYDHRDYNYALSISPVCRGCNARRGRAIPRNWREGEWDAYLQGAVKPHHPKPHVWNLIELTGGALRADRAHNIRPQEQGADQ
jgi:hypothetical protein